MADNYTLSAKITADARGFAAGLGSAGKALDSAKQKAEGISGKLQNFGKKAGGIGKSLTKNVTKPAMVAVTAIGGIFAYQGSRRLIAIDDAKAKLTGLGHSAESTGRIMESTTKAVKGTSYGLGEAATVAASAVAAGIAPGKELTKYLGLAGDAAAIAGGSLAEIGPIFNRVQTANRAYNYDLQQLSDRGLPIYQWLGKAAGVTADQVRDMASKGQISAQTFRDAIEQNIGGAAKKMGESSFTAGFNNVKAALGRVGEAFLDAGGKGGGMFSTIKSKLPEFTKSIDSLSGVAENWGRKFGETISKIIDVVKSLIEWFRSLPHPVKEAVEKIVIYGGLLAVAAGPIASGIGKITGMVRILIGAFNAAKTAISAVSSVLSFLALSPAGWIVIAITAIIASIVLLIIYWGKVVNEVKFVGSVINNEWQFIKNRTAEFVQNVKNKWNEFWVATKALGAKLAKPFVDTFNKIWSVVKNIFTKIGNFIAGVVKGISKVVGGVLKAIKIPINLVVDGINLLIKGANYFKLGIPLIPHLQSGTKSWQGGFARINEGGRGELVSLPQGTQVIPHDVSMQYARESARRQVYANQHQQMKQIDIAPVVDWLKKIYQKDTSVYLDRQKVGQGIQPITDRISGEQVSLRERWSLQ